MNPKYLKKSKWISSSIGVKNRFSNLVGKIKRKNKKQNKRSSKADYKIEELRTKAIQELTRIGYF